MSGLYVALTNHGYGHAARTGSILNDLHQALPELQIIVASTHPEPVLRKFIRAPFILRPVALDTGLIQKDSLQIDHETTLRELDSLYRRKQNLLEVEAEFIRSQKLGLVLGDIPPLAADLALLAGVPCWMLSNFGWDFIFEDFAGDFTAFAQLARESYERSSLLFRLPFHESMNAFPKIQDVGVTGSIIKSDPEEIRERLSLPDGVPLILMVFGGMGLDGIPYNNLKRFNGNEFPRAHFITFDQNAPELSNLTTARESGYRVTDLLPLADRVLSKPGYGMLADVFQAKVPFFALEREGFAEAPVLKQALADHFQHRMISTTEFFESDWSFLAEEPVEPTATEHPGTEGNREVVTEILSFFQGRAD